VFCETGLNPEDQWLIQKPKRAVDIDLENGFKIMDPIN
jgi:hypothetical protein